MRIHLFHRRKGAPPSLLNSWLGCAEMLLCATIIFGLSGCLPAKAKNIPQETTERIFPETGHSLSGEFLQFYENSPDSLAIYGYPITDAFIDPVFGRVVQYFEKARFELFPAEPPGQRVQLSALGEWLYEPGQPRALAAYSPSCRSFSPRNDIKSDERFRVCYAFLEFFDAHGGLKEFGYPLSNLESHDGHLVQYFQKARFEWVPNYPFGQRVQLSNLGSLYFSQQAMDQSYLIQGNNAPQTVLHLNVRLYPDQAVKDLQGQQGFNVVVQDQNMLPVANAAVNLTLFSPSGKEASLPLQARTDKNGLAHLVVPFETNEPGLFIINATARLGDVSGQGYSSFRAWW